MLCQSARQQGRLLIAAAAVMLTMSPVPAAAQVMANTPAGASTVPKGTDTDVSFTIAVQSDYVSRGISQSEGRPLLSGGFDAARGIAYAGAFVSGVRYAGDPSTTAEINLYAGIRPEWRALRFDLGVSASLYPGQPAGAGYDSLDLYVGVSRDFGRLALTGYVYHSPDYAGVEEGAATYIEAGAAYAVSPRLSVSAGVGHQQTSSDRDHTAWHAGAMLAVARRVTVELRYHDTTRADLGAEYRSRLVLTARARF